MVSNGLRLLLDKLNRLGVLVFHIDLYSFFLCFVYLVSVFFWETEFPNLVQYSASAAVSEKTVYSCNIFLVFGKSSAGTCRDLPAIQ